MGRAAGDDLPATAAAERGATGLFDGVFARGGAAAAASDAGWIGAMLSVERALARAEAAAGVITAERAAEIDRACGEANVDAASIGRAAADGGNPVIPLVAAIRRALPADAAADVHRGATSQDVVDTAMMLVCAQAIDAIVGDLRGAGDAAADLAARHRDTLMAGRTLLQQALPITFGLKAAGWMSALDAAWAELRHVRETRLAVQLGGAAGTLASLGSAGLEVRRLLAAELRLPEPVLAWHTDRTRVGQVAGALGVAAGAVAKPARDVVLLAQTEVAEVREGGGARGGEAPGPRGGDAPGPRGGSSTLPHKHNPIAAVSVLACTGPVPGLVASLLASMVQEHERAAGAWHAEWRPMSELLRLVGSAAAWLRDCLEHLEVDAARMRQNLGLTDGLVLAEHVRGEIAPIVGSSLAPGVVDEALRRVAADRLAFADALLANPALAAALSRADVDAMLDPAAYLGSSGQLVDLALAQRAARSSGTVPP